MVPLLFSAQLARRHGLGMDVQAAILPMRARLAQSRYP